MSQIILLSGGMDSLISHRLFYPDATPVFVFSGSRYSTRDWNMAVQQVPVLHTIDAPDLREWANGVVPHRNAVLLATVANRCRATEIIVSAPRGEMIWDQQRAFHRSMQRVLKGVRIRNPLRHLTKTQAVAAWKAARLPSAELLASRSCYSAEPGQCGQCPACVKRWIAITNNGLTEHYRADVRQHATKLAKLGSLRDLFRYGARPTYEAWQALNK